MSASWRRSTGRRAYTDLSFQAVHSRGGWPFLMIVDPQGCKGEPVAIASGLEHICSPCFAVGPEDRAVLIWCQKQQDKGWELRRSDCADLGRWSEARALVAEGNPRYSCAAFDAKGGLWISYTADAEQGRQVKTMRLE